MRQKLKDVFEDGNRSLLKIDDEQRLDVDAALVDLAHEKNTGIIFLCLEDTYLKVKKQLRDQELSETHVKYIDGITKIIVNKDVPQDDKVTYVKRTSNLQNISLSVSVAADFNNVDKVVLVIDSLLVLFMTHTEKQVVSFFEDLQQRMETLHLNLVLFDEGRALEDRIGEHLYATVDNTIFLRDNQS